MVTAAWNRRGFDEFEAGLPPARLKRDKLHLQSVFNVAARVPMLKQALLWAKENDIRFFVDHTCKNLGGYYVEGAGIAAIAKGALSFLPKAVGVVVHEIAHAWQDKQGLLPTEAQRFADHYINLSLVEAHAKALQKRAAVETALLLPHISAGFYLRMQEDHSLWQNYAHWFKTDLPVVYGTSAVRERGHQMGLEGFFPEDRQYEFPGAVHAGMTQGGINVRNQNEIWRLSSDFEGKPFFSEKTGPEFLSYVTDPLLALRFYQEEWPAPANQVQQLISEEFHRRIRAPSR